MTKKSLTLVVGHADKFCSGLVIDRYQIIESFIPGQFLIWDHETDDLIRDRSGEIVRFKKLEDAEEVIEKESRSLAPLKKTRKRNKKS